MYMALRRYTLIRADAADEFVRRVMAQPALAGPVVARSGDWATTEWGFAPLVSRTPGFQAYYLTDVGAGEIITISFFADRAGAEASTREAAAWVRGHAADLVQGPPEVLTGDVKGYEQEQQTPRA